MAGGGQVADHALSVCALGHVLNVGGFNLVTQGGLHGFTTFFMLAHPTSIGQRRHV